MNPEDEKLITFTHRIFEKTKNGELRWEATANSNVFAVAFPKYSVSLERVPETDDTRGFIVLRISNDRGQTVEEFSSWQASRSGFEDMAELFDRARRIAMGLNEALDELLRDLDEPAISKP
jgi:hypothetical protein